MIRLPQQPRLTDFPISSWLKTVRGNVQSSQIISGGDISATQTPHGIQLKGKKNDGFFMRWVGGWQENSEYRKGDVVEVTEDREFTGKDANQETVAYQSKKGIWVCTYNVPCYLDMNLFSSLPDYAYEALSLNLRVTDVVYAPIYPLPENSPDALPEGTIQGRYWNLIAFAPSETYVCENGEQRTVYVHYARSGSVDS